MQPLWLYLHFPQLQLDKLYCQEQAAAATVILDAASNQIKQLNAAARQAGLQEGMGLGTAAALCHQLQVLQYQYALEQQQLQELAQGLYQITADITLVPPCGLLLRIHTMLALYQGIEGYWLALQGHLQQQKLSYYFATAHTPLAAKLLALSQHNQLLEDPEGLQQAIAQSPLVYSELSSNVLKQLARLNIHHMGDLLTIPRSELANRFAREVNLYLGKLQGDIPHPIVYFHPPQQFKRYLELMYDISQRDTLQHPLKQLFLELEQFLQIKDKVAQATQITLYQREAATLDIAVVAGQGEYKASRWLSLAELKLEQVQLQAPVFAVELQSQQEHLKTPEVSDLFSQQNHALNPQQLQAILRAKLGVDAVTGISLNNDPRPELSTLYPAQPPCQVPQIHMTALPQNRPAFLLTAPIPLQEKVTVYYGPERITCGWWDNHAICRDYFIARSSKGHWYWIFKTPKQQWFQHGVFS